MTKNQKIIESLFFVSTVPLIQKDLIKVLKGMGEKAKIAIRNIRREGNEELKKNLKDKVISEDDSKNFEKSIQKITDTNIENIEKRINENKDIFDRDYNYVKVTIDKNFPEYITENKEKFKDWII